MNKITELLTERSDKVRARFESEIQDQKRELSSAKTRVVNSLLGLECNTRFTTREQFTYVAKVEETLRSMLMFYKDMYGIDYEDPKPTEENETAAL